jgi:methionyl-tRNA formyltransferase
MRIGFVTAVQLGLDCLDEIERLDGKLDLLITLDDDTATKKSGRVQLDDYARRTGVSLHKTKHINEPATIEAIRQADLDYLLVIGWSQLVAHEIFPLVKRALLGIHPTLLPEGRGRAPIPWTILKGLKRSGVSMFELKPEVDSGDIMASESFDVAPDETATTLYEKARHAHVALIRKTWPDLTEGTLRGHPQDETKATHWPQRRPEDGEITEQMSLEDIAKLVRATTHPYPGAFLVSDEKKCIIWSGQITKIERSRLVMWQLVRGDFCFEPIEYQWLD